MKIICTTITLFLFTLNVYAQFKIKISPTDNSIAKMEIEEKNLNKAIKRLSKIVKKSSWLKYVKNEEESGYIFSEVEEDLDGNEKTYYYHPVNFSIAVEDITQELADKEALKQARKDEIAEIKNMKDTIKSSDLPNWHKKLLKRLVKELRD